ncbi:MAG: hypothetical protein DDT42_01793 [candidate division WS2 bacterium]|uniref:Recombination endonuclease VII n=1 Tax=Psychracetigena formicireducens TaxID=2986056 RepID=A0A9E2F580_PSYF1|nr:hypothetical protein [Candidatus Psychracetigena formicireducens]
MQVSLHFANIYVTSQLKLKGSQVKTFREKLWLDQKQVCELCGAPLSLMDAVLDHDHKTGLVRATIHRSCNSGLGAIERVSKYGVKDILVFANGAAKYLEKYAVDQTQIIHPSHFTPEEKALRAAARRKRKKSKLKTK